jgi:hypothetical protein
MNRQARKLAAGVPLILTIALAGCGSSVAPTPSPEATGTAAPATPTPVEPTPTLAPTAAPTPSPQATESLTEVFPRDRFGDPTTIDNPWFPLVPGTQWVWDGTFLVDGQRVGHSVTFTVTDLVKVVDGVHVVVGYDEDYQGDELIEAEVAFWAQDDDGTVWHLGQYPEEYEGGEIVDAPTWIAGVRDAAAGISMKATPGFSAFSYSQGWGPEVGWTDRARVLEMGSRTCVPVGCYDNVLVVDEFNRDEPDAHQLKYYAEGIGNVRVGWAGALELEQEVLELVRFAQLDADELDAVREAALALERRAYERSPQVYGQTSPMEPRPG